MKNNSITGCRLTTQGDQHRVCERVGRNFVRKQVTVGECMINLISQYKFNLFREPQSHHIHLVRTQGTQKIKLSEVRPCCK